MALTFQQKLQIEQLRAVEQACGMRTAPVLPRPKEGFEAWLVRRSEALGQQPDLAAALHHGPHWLHLTLGVILVILAVLGMATSFQAVAGGTDTLNIFWILAVLLGFNWLSLLLWLVLTFFLRQQGGGVLAPIMSGALHAVFKVARSSPLHSAASHAWLSLRFAPPQGSWFLSQMVHLGWLSFLAGGFICLLLLLATRQFDFVWASTLLTGQTFVRLTEVLAAPLQILHWPTPTDAQILASQPAFDQHHDLDSAAARRAWAMFLLGCLLLYGFVPRLVAWGVCGLQHRRLRRGWQLPLSEPYYLRLQQQFWPQASAAQVVDADQQVSGTTPVPQTQPPVPIPEGAIWLGLELPQPLLSSTPEGTDNVRDPLSLKQAMSRLQRVAQSPRAIVVDGDKPADRGLQRTLQQLVAMQPTQCWLLMLTRERVSKHQHSWRQAAQACAVPPNHVVERNL